MALEKYIKALSERDPHIPVIPFLAILGEYARGRMDGAIVPDAIIQSLSLQSGQTIVLDQDCMDDINMFLSIIDSLPGIAERILYILELQNVMMLAEYSDFGIYQTREQIKQRLGLK
jgi:hypothetical protein